MVPDAIQQRIRHQIERGYLPRNHTIELWRGVSFGHVCDGCGAAIESNDPVCLLCGEDWTLIRFHLDCFRAWELEKSDLAGATEPTRPAAGEPDQTT